jgi:hypothetical protein
MRRMNLYKNNLLFLFGLLFLFNGKTFAQKKDKKKVSLEIQFENIVGDKPLELDSGKYINNLGQEFSITKFNYYISNIRLIRNDGKVFISDSYFLIKEEDSLSKLIELEKIPPGTYSSIQFTIGVDSLKNCSGIQTGALDPMHGMFWTWNTGYIFLKLEGMSSSSTLPNEIIEYHIGGFTSENNAVRTIKKDLRKELIISKKNKSILTITSDVLEILKTPTDIDFSVTPAVTGIENAQTICTNYMDAFTIKTSGND